MSTLKFWMRRISLSSTGFLLPLQVETESLETLLVCLLGNKYLMALLLRKLSRIIWKIEVKRSWKKWT